MKKTELNTCLPIQEELAWGRTLTAEDQKHVVGCPACNALSLEFSRLDSAYSLSEVKVPDGFADKVMSRIEYSERPRRLMEKFHEWTDLAAVFFQLKPVRYVLFAFLLALPLSAAGAA